MLLNTLERLNDARRQKQPVVLLTFLDDGIQSLYFRGGTVTGRELSSEQQEQALQTLSSDRCRLSDDGGVFYQPFNPPLRMIVVGAVHISKSLIAMAKHCGYQVTVVDPRQAFAAAARFPDVTLISDWPDTALTALAPDSRTAIVTLTHDPKLDDPALLIALQSEAFYIGALGSRKTQQARCDRLTQQGVSAAQQARIHGPIGLDIGAQSPAEIAVAIMAQVTEALHRGSR